MSIMKKEQSDVIRKYERERDPPFGKEGPHWLEISGALAAIKQELECPMQLKPDSSNAYNNVAELADNLKYWSRN